MPTNKIFGPPGTGKTTFMLNTVQHYLSEGVSPKNIGYLAFTTKAAKEAKHRALEKFPHLNANHLQGFRTIHSLCYSICGYSTGDIIQRNHYSELCKKLSIPYSGYVNMEEGTVADILPGDRLIFIEGLAKARRRTFMEEFDEAQSPGVGRQEAILFDTALKNFKQSHMLDDFNDMLIHVAHGKFQVPAFEVLFVDEAQDLSKLQWAVVQKLIQKAKFVYIAGDDDQAIFSWAGADPESFLGLDGDVSVLDCTYRLPKKVFNMAKNLSETIQVRQQKVWSPRPEADQGLVEWVRDINSLELDKGSWLILARNSYLLKEAQELCFQEGYSYEGKNSLLESESLRAIRAYEDLRAGREVGEDGRKLVAQYGWTGNVSSNSPIWHEALLRIPIREKEYFIAARGKGESLLRPRIRLSTIHGAKGGEADHVAVYTEVSMRSYETMQRDPDSETRVFYVAATRAKKSLHFIEPKGMNYFKF